MQKMLKINGKSNMKPRLVFLCNVVKMTRQGLFNAECLGINFLQFSALPAKRPMTFFLDIEYTSITEAGVSEGKGSDLEM